MRVRVTTWVSGGVLVLCIALVAALAVLAQGYPVRKLELNDSGIWVTNDAELSFGRVNKSAVGLDAWLDAPGGTTKRELDVLQDGNAALEYDAVSASVVPMNTAEVSNVNEGARTLPPGSVIDMRGGTVAAFDPEKGAIRASRYDPRNSQVRVEAFGEEADPLVELGKAPEGVGRRISIAVDVNGGIHAVAADGKMVRIPALDGGFAKPETSQLDGGFKGVQITTVGDQPVVLDAEQGVLVLPGGKRKQLDSDPSAVLQRPGETTNQVLVATAKGLLRVNLTSGEVTTVAADQGGQPAIPVRVAGCDFGARAGGGVVRACDGHDTEQLAKMTAKTALVRPVFRVNRNQVVLNDSADGKIFDLSTQNRLDDWDKIKPKTGEQNQNPTNQVKPSKKDAKPVANPDTVGVRVGQTAVGHLLDNDSDALGQILMITEVTDVPDGVSVAISPDAQTVAITGSKAVGSFSFKYSISNGANSSSSSVSVQLITDQQNRDPRLRDGFQPTEYTVASFGTLPLSVLADWRDDDGDALAVVSAEVGGQPVPVTPEGRIEFVAGREDEQAVKVLSYKVSDGRTANPVSQQINVTVLGANGLTGTPATTYADSVRGEAGTMISFNPLANDIPGSDPRMPDAKLRLGAQPKPVAGLKIDADLGSGEVKVVAAAPGSYELEYVAAFGSSAMQSGKVRLDVTPAGVAGRPTAMPDQATMRGDTQIRVDPIANDFDPRGGLLTVTSASADEGGAEAAVVSGRWVIITATSGGTGALNVSYKVSNGSQEATSTITVVRLPEVDKAQPLVKDDLAVVRAGDSVLVNALSNDVEPNGAPLNVVTNTPGLDKVGELQVYLPSGSGQTNAEETGRAFVHNNRIRYVAPAEVSQERQVVIEYLAQNTAGQRSATGKVLVTIKPEPPSPADDRAPEPEAVEARVNAGDRVKISIPNGTQDPDGDSVTVIGIGSAPTLGRVVGTSPTGATYEAYPDPGSFGTDTFTLLVADRYGKASLATVRVGVTQPGSAQTPLAVEDSAIAEPGALVRVDAMSNDLYSRADRVEIAPLEDYNDQLPDGTKLNTPTGPIAVKAPQENAQPVIVQYGLKGNAGAGPAAAVKVTSQAGYKNPPVIFDEVAVVSGNAGQANVLARAWDPDGSDKELKATLLGGPAGSKLVDGKAEIPLTGQPQIVPFQVVDSSGASSVAVIFVPSSGTSAPHLRSGGLIRIEKDSTLELKLDDYVYSPRNLAIRFTPDSAFSASPIGKLSVEPSGTNTFKVTSKEGYVGPAAVTFEVMDGESTTTEGVLKAVISVPVQVGSSTPVLRCPTTAVKVTAGGRDQALDIATLCHVWSPDSASIDDLIFTADWKDTKLSGVEAESGHLLNFRAAGSAVPGQQATMMIGVKGVDVVKQPITVVVLEAPPPTMSGRTFSDIKQGTAVTIPLGIRSPLRDAKPNIVSVRKVSGSDAKVDSSGTNLVITPGSDTHGVLVFDVTASDVADRSRVDRQVRAIFTLEVYGRPSAPGVPVPGEKVQSRSVNLTWSVPADNGAPIQHYLVKSSLGQTYTCPANSCRIEGLRNNVAVRFKVVAVNRAGEGAESGWSREIIPDQPPPAPSGLRVSNPRDHLLTLSWSPIVVDGSPVKVVHIIIDGKAYQTSRGDQTSFELPTPDNNGVHQITVIAENNFGKGSGATILGQSAGAPIGLQPPRFTAVSLNGPATAVNVAWNGVDKNGPSDLTYTLVRDGGKTICAGVKGTSCVDDSVTYDGTVHRYTLTATNGAGGPSHTATTTGSWAAIGVPDAGAPPSVQATGTDRQVRVSGTAPDSHGQGSRLEILSNGAVVYQTPLNPRGERFTRDVSAGANGSASAITYRVCNEQRCGPASAGVSVTPFGPLGGVKITDAGSKGPVVNYTITVEPNGKPVEVRVNGASIGSTGNGTWSKTLGENIGYSQEKTFELTVSDGSRSAKTSVKLRAEDPPPPPPPPPAPARLVVTSGSRVSRPDCAAANCRNVTAETVNFKGNVTCWVSNTMNSPGVWSGSGFGLRWTQAPNTKHESNNYFGFYGVEVTCQGQADGSVVGRNTTWPN